MESSFNMTLTLALSHFLVEDEVIHLEKKVRVSRDVSRPIAGAIPTLTPCPRTPPLPRL
jgi:hypothetical protein